MVLEIVLTVTVLESDVFMVASCGVAFAALAETLRFLRVSAF
jgi:hypothetical protein